jgi:hypothetical protein
VARGSGGDGAGEITAAIEALKEAIEKHGESRFVKINEWGDRMGEAIIRDALGYRITFGTESRWLFTPSGWREILKGIADPTLVARELDRRGMLVVTPSEAKRHQLAKKISGERLRLYAVRAARLFGENV